MSASQALREFDRWDDPEALEQVVPALLAVVEAAEQIEQGPIFVGSRLGNSLAALYAKLANK